MKTIVNTLIQSILRLRDVIIVTFFILTVFSLIGMQLYQGVLRGRCVSLSNSSYTNRTEYSQFINDSGEYLIFL